jgi:cell wall-associated NlpC family hydrolase
MIKDFVNLAIGVPFVDQGRSKNGWDCWGLVYCGYEFKGVHIPSYANISALDHGKVIKQIQEGLDDWVMVSPTQVQPWDVVLIRNGSFPDHVGLVVKKGKMLHVDPYVNTCIEDYNSILWASRVVGIFRYAKFSTD